MTERLARRSRIVSSAAALTLLAAASALIGLPGCGSKMEEKECTKLKIEAFDLLNKAQHCNNDSDCNGSDWPDCQKPLSAANTEAIQKKRDAYFTGQCEEQKPVCSDTTPVYCKQGLCVRKEKGAEGTP